MENRFSRLKPREFEELIRELFIKMGYNASLTPYISDFGADIIAKKEMDVIVIQVKKYKPDHKVGRVDVQKVLGSTFKYKANKAILITTSSFTDEAREQARDAPIELWDYYTLIEKIEKYLL
jgi:restriction system protein